MTGEINPTGQKTWPLGSLFSSAVHRQSHSKCNLQQLTVSARWLLQQHLDMAMFHVKPLLFGPAGKIQRTRIDRGHEDLCSQFGQCGQNPGLVTGIQFTGKIIQQKCTTTLLPLMLQNDLPHHESQNHGFLLTTREM
jgi:hypothetical protein